MTPYWILLMWLLIVFFNLLSLPLSSLSGRTSSAFSTLDPQPGSIQQLSGAIHLTLHHLESPSTSSSVLWTQTPPPKLSGATSPPPPSLLPQHSVATCPYPISPMKLSSHAPSPVWSYPPGHVPSALCRHLTPTYQVYEAYGYTSSVFWAIHLAPPFKW